VVRSALGVGADLVITADHGNIEEMRDPEGRPQTKHTTSPVPFVLVSQRFADARLRDGELSDVAPTLCQLLGIPPGPQMTGHSLIE
jgi:2,3-bisphosphoglycerate-independent phosphoglycerate mutase